MGFPDIILLALLAVWAFFALRSVIRKKGACCGSCSGCSRAGNCCQRR